MIKLVIDTYIGQEKMGVYSVDADDEMKHRLYNVFKMPTFVFMLDEVYKSVIPKKVKDSVNVLGEDAGLTVDEILAMDVMFVLMDSKEDVSRVQGIVGMAEAYSKKKLRYVVVR